MVCCSGVNKGLLGRATFLEPMSSPTPGVVLENLTGKVGEPPTKGSAALPSLRYVTVSLLKSAKEENTDPRELRTAFVFFKN